MADEFSAPAACPAALPGYELLDQIGEGGMGQVHRATQLSLGRTVAVKFLSPLAAGVGASLHQESRLMASLAHPHVVTIHDCGQVEGRPYLIMEYVDGRTLRARMKPGRPWPVTEAAPVLDAVAQALSYIHDRGILHLDLKPENVLCGKDGTLKITDFGLAAPDADVRAFADRGLACGTLDYGSPEQRHGLPRDRRSDVFSLAVLAYELLTGELPGRVYVPASKRNRSLPRAADDVLRRGLARHADQRPATVEEFRRALLEALGWRNRAPSGRRPLLRAAPAVGLALALGGLILAPSFRRDKPGGEPGAFAPALSPPGADAPRPPEERPPFRWAAFGGPDSILYPVRLDGGYRLFRLGPDGRQADHLGGDDLGDCYFPACSPDGGRIAFTADRDGSLQLFVMDADGRNVRQLTRGGNKNRAPSWSPDGRKIAFASERDGNSEIYVMNADGSGQVNLTHSPAFEADPAWSPDGRHIAFVASGRDEVKGYPLYVMDADGGNVRPLRAEDLPGYVYPAWSPDGKRLAYGGRGEHGIEMFLCDADGGNPRRLTNLGGVSSVAAWSPDGSRLAFQFARHDEKRASLYVINADGSGLTEVLHNAGVREGGRPAWARAAK